MIGITGKALARYVLLPEFKPRLKELFASGFQYVPYFIALVYAAVRLLPPNHPYLDSRNRGQFGVRAVIAQAANNLVFSAKNIDQILLFSAILLGMGLLFVQFCLLATALFIGPVMAAMPTSFSGFFLTPADTQAQDIAGMMMDLVFGIPDLFNSCVSDMAVPCLSAEGAAIKSSNGTGSWPLEPAKFPMPAHVGIHQVFQMYSLALLVVATFITIYFITMILLETAESGTPFGKRYNKVWAPIRLVVAFGLLVPVGYGLNSSQYIVLYAAKFGSGFATNGWNFFNETLMSGTNTAVKNLAAGEHVNSENNLVASPTPPEIGGFLQFLFTAKTCAEMEAVANGAENNAKESKETRVMPYLVKDPFANPNNLPILETTSYEDIIKFANGKDQLIIRFGRHDPKKYPMFAGNVGPTCGEMTMRLADPRPPAASGGTTNGRATAEKGVEIMQRFYVFALKEEWYREFTGYGGLGENFPLNYTKRHSNINQDKTKPLPDEDGADYKGHLLDWYRIALCIVMHGTDEPKCGRTKGLKDSEDLNNLLGTNGANLTDQKKGAIQEMSESGRWTVDNTLRQKGWAGAAIWYNRIAELNGTMTSAVLNVPMPTYYPEVMEHVYQKKRQTEKNITFSERFKPAMVGKDAPGNEAVDGNKAGVYWEAFNYWQTGNFGASAHVAPTGNAIVDMLNSLMGTEGLFNLRNNTDTHPLALLTGLGRSLIEGAIRHLTYAAVGGLGGAFLSTINQFVGGALATVSDFLVTFSLLGLTAGFVLFYIVPLMPFLYFFFALGGWIKAIFEAMVGAPLWALAHIRIGGEGLSGRDALTGYHMIFEIFLRPILMIFGLLASISIFSAMVSVLNQVFDLVTANVGGFDASAVGTDATTGKITDAISQKIGKNIDLGSMRSAVDEFFFTILYAVIVYMLGMSSFKLIDQIPATLLRWMGANVNPFKEENGLAEGLASQARAAGSQLGSSLGDGLKKGLKGIEGLGKK